tara:strand:- start:659 stop:781 length:123 start_codon:yes stop_codon:yes gene_type:complete
LYDVVGAKQVQTGAKNSEIQSARAKKIEFVKKPTKSYSVI